ncbi:hypothetical protein HYDPIDRAFT_28226 [Hydnomerulius pinastri MD-312]|uniref:Uncharacterized protein n=1 Tax=Hydnomerulius pinastri MD-312 TaxID=994086 RepID=A0A0C9WG62_9AGAM|nr:hypothetical protein HYDPIDRAFT_28226 [Hydnomerulius pinastri MD-312]
MASNVLQGLPPMGKISLIGIWMETVLYGVNVIIYGLCMFVLWREKRGLEMLSITSTVLFLMCTIHVAASLRQMLEAFIYAPSDVPNYSTLYWLSQTAPMAVLKAVLYDNLVFLQDIVLIWRLYIVWGRNWKVVVLPIIAEGAHMACAYAATAVITQPGTQLYNSLFSRLGSSGWALDITLNVSVTLAIALRLWWMGRRVSALYDPVSARYNRYASVIYTVVESGGLFAAVTVVMLGLYVGNSPVAFTGLDIASQLAVLSPLLIVVRVGLGMTHGLPKAYEQVTASPSMQRAARDGHSVQTAGSRMEGPRIEFPRTHELELDNISDRSQTFATGRDVKV